MQTVLRAEQISEWRDVLAEIPNVDVCFLPEFHLAYETREQGAQAYLWIYRDGSYLFAYPFQKTAVTVISHDGSKSVDLPYYDISSVYGFTGPISNSSDADFIKRAWERFDLWARKESIIAEFIRFSPYSNNAVLAASDTQVIINRKLAVSRFPEEASELFQTLPSKTRNMIRKAEKANLVAEELCRNSDLNKFRTLYELTMARNTATDFFSYDDVYYTQLQKLHVGEMRLFGVFNGEEMVSTAMCLVWGKNAVYHLGASMPEHSKNGAGNLCLYYAGCALIRSGVHFLNLTGGRTTAPDDALFRFKKNNSTHIEDFLIGKRILDQTAYNEVEAEWGNLNKGVDHSKNLIFWRS